MKHLFKKELDYYLNNPIGYVILCLFGVFMNFIYIKDLFVNGAFSASSFFAFMPWIFLVFIPAIAMRSVAEEKKQNTIEILYSLPLSETQIVLAKYAALVALLTVGILLTVSIPITIGILSTIYIPELIVGYLGTILLGMLFLSVSLFFSSQTNNQIVAFLVSALSLFLLLGTTSDLLATILPKSVQTIFLFIGPLTYFDNLSKGVIDLKSILYFSSLIALFVTLTIQGMKKKQ